MNFTITASMFAQAIVLLSTCAGAEASLFPINLTVSDQIGAKRTGEAVCSGVPFARGVLQPGDPVHVESGDGVPLVTQTKMLGQWPDGSVKWLLVQFSADCPANGQEEYHLTSGTGPEAESQLVIRDEDEQIVIDTGALVVTVSKTELSVPGDVSFRNPPMSPFSKGGFSESATLSEGGFLEFVLEDGTVHDTSGSTPESVTVEEAGPLRATVRVVGWLQGPGKEQLYKLDARLRFYAGQSHVRADYTFICLGQPPLHHVKEISVEFSPELGDTAKFILPGDQEPTIGALAAEQTAVLSVDTETVCSVGLDGEQKKAEKHMDGWGLLMGDNASVGVALRDFWHLCPKAIELSTNGIKIALWSARGGKILNLGRTRAKTHHVLYDFGASAETDRLRAFQEPLIAITDPEYFCTTDALNPLSPAGAAETAEYDQKVEQGFDNLRDQRATMPRENGMLHYGDYYHGGYGNDQTRGDLEYDTGHACFLLYARSGERKYYDFAIACNEHFIDMDVSHETGDQRFHGYSERAETHEAVTTSMEWGHIFTDCPADAYYFTGDERSLEAVKMIADRVSTIADGEGYEKIRGIFAGAERQLGWPLQALCRAYEVTGDEKYLKASEKVVNFIKIYAKDPLTAYSDGSWWRSWMMDGCKVFMTGQLHDGLAAYYRLTGDEELREVIVTSLDWLMDNMWYPETGGFVYEFNAMNRKHRQMGITGLNMLVVDAFRFGYEMTGDRRYLSVAVRAFWGQAQDMKPGHDGKQFSLETRTSPHTAAYFYREHITPENLPEAPQPITQGMGDPVPDAPGEVLLHADFDGDLSCETPTGEKTGEAVGQIEFVPGRSGQAVAVGKDGYAWLPAPLDMLRGPGSIELWVRLHFKKHLANPGQRAVFHIEGQTPLVDSLAACTIYDELRIRMKNHVGHLDGSAEGSIIHWEPNEWHHVVITWDEKRVKLYLDGEEQIREDEGQQAQDGVNYLPAGQQTRINLGWRFGNWYCDCDIDELTVYSRTLTAKEIAARYTGK